MTQRLFVIALGLLIIVTLTLGALPALTLMTGMAFGVVWGIGFKREQDEIRRNSKPITLTFTGGRYTSTSTFVDPR